MGKGVRKAPPREKEKLLRITGLPAVKALFETAPQRIERLFFDSKTKHLASAYCAEMAKRRRIYRLVNDDEMARVAGTVLHGGIVALTRPRPVIDFDPEDAILWAKENKLLLVMDGVSNPHNFGAIVRTAAFLGVPRILISDHPNQALPSDASYRISEGGMEHIALFHTRSFIKTLQRLKQSHTLIGTAAEGGKPLANISPGNKPFALIMGNEENGIPPATLKMCDIVTTIPGTGTVQSLNVSASAAILMYALSVHQG